MLIVSFTEISSVEHTHQIFQTIGFVL